MLVRTASLTGKTFRSILNLGEAGGLLRYVGTSNKQPMPHTLM